MKRVLKTLTIPGADGAALDVAVEFVFSRRARRIHLRLPRSGPVRIVIPLAAGDPEAVMATATEFFGTQRDWYFRVLRRREKAAALLPARPSGMGEFFATYPRVIALGREYAVELGETTGRPFVVWRAGSEEPALFRHRAGAAREADLLALTRAFAKEALPRRVMELAAQTGIAVGRVCVRDQRGRWGSCSSRGAVSLNWRLVLVTPVLQDYVILHELAHRREMNHSDRFWDLLAQWDPRCGWNDRALSKEWGWLMRFGR
jgi:predicted metal-dependent hydrolase